MANKYQDIGLGLPQNYSIREYEKTDIRPNNYHVVFKGKLVGSTYTASQALSLVDKHEVFIKASAPVYQRLLDDTQMIHGLIKAHTQTVCDTLDNLQEMFPDFDVGPYSLYFFNDDEEV